MRKSLLVLLLIFLSSDHHINAQTPVATPTSKLAWVITAADLNTAQSYVYKYYLDASATGIIFSPSPTCSGTAAPFSCQVAFPAVGNGNHTISITASNTAGESLHSDPFAFAFVGIPSKPTGLRIIL